MLKNRAAYNTFLSEKGILLSELGTQEYALDQQNAMSAIVMIEDLGIPILGGDVYLHSSEGIEISYENWSIKRQPSELLDNYVFRSCAYTRDYILRFPVQAEKLPLFVLVLASDLQMILP